MAGELGRFTGQLILDVKQAVAAYTEARQEHLSTVSALGAGAGAFVTIGTALTAAGVGMAAGLFTAAKAAGEFERQLDFFGAVSDATQKEMEAVRKKALQLNRDTIYTAGEIGDAFTELAKAGASAGDILKGVGEAVINLGAATDMPLAEAATSLTSILNTFQISAEDSVSVVDKLAGAANASSIDVQDLILTMTYAGASAKVAGIEFSDINTAIALLGERGIKGSKAGTGLRQMLNKLIAPTKKGTGALKELGIITEDGTNNLLEMDGSLKPIPKLLDIINTATDGLSSSDKMNVLGRIFPITALPTILSLLDGGAEGMARLTKEIDKTTAAEVASKRLDNLSGDLEYLKSSAENLMITLGGLIQGPMRALIQAITAVVDWLSELDPAWLSLLVSIAAVSAVLLTVIGVMGLFAGAIMNIIQLAVQMQTVFGVLIKVIPGLGFALAKLKAAMLFPGTPIIAIFLAIAGALAYFFTQTEKGQQVWGQLMALFQQGLAAVGPLLEQFASVLGGLLSSALTALIPMLQVVGNILMTVLAPFIPIITNMLTLLGAAFSGIGQGIGQSIGGFAAFAEIGAQIVSGIISAIPIILTALVEIVIVIVNSIVTWAPMILSAALTVFMNLITALTTLLGPITTALIQLVTQLITALIGMLPSIISGSLALFNGIITAIVTLAPLLVTAVLNLVLSLVAALITMIPTLIEAALQLFMGLLEAIPVILPPLIDAVINMLLAVITALIGMLPTLLDAGIQVFMALIDAVIKIVPDLIVQIINLIPTIIGVLITLIPALLNGAIQLFLALVQALPKIIPKLITAIIGLIPVIVSTVISLVPQLIQAAITLFMGIAQAVVKVVPKLITSLVDMGKQLIEGLGRGIRNAADVVMKAIGNVVNGAINWAKGLLGIKSPSRVFRAIGDNTIKGMVIGITNQAPALQRSFGMIEDSLDQFYDQVYAAREFDVMMNLQSQMGVSASNGLAAQFAELNETLAEIADKDTVVVEKMEVNNPEPEKPSESLPRGIRKAAYMVG